MNYQGCHDEEIIWPWNLNTLLKQRINSHPGYYWEENHRHRQPWE